MKPAHNADYVAIVKAADKVLEEWKTGSMNDLAWAMDKLREAMNQRRNDGPEETTVLQ